MIDAIATNIRTICENRTEIYPVKNIIFTKIAAIAGLKNVRFDSQLNIAGESPLSHYCLNFMPSGGNKNSSINAIDKHVFKFVKDEINAINEEIKQDYIDKRSGKDKNTSLDELKREAEEQEMLFEYIVDATPEALYDNVELISKIKKGFICNKCTEYAQYFEKSVFDKASNNNRFLDIFYDSWDGLFASRKIRGKQRREIEGITCSVIWLSNFDTMKKPKIFETFKDRLNGGYARRIYPFYDPRINYTLYPPEEVSIKDKIEAKKELEKYSKLIKDKFNAIPQNALYQVDDSVCTTLSDWHKIVCGEKARELYKGQNRALDINNAIIEKIYANSKWTILKLLVILHVINNPTSLVIDDTYLNEAILFWQDSVEYWKNIVFDKNYTDIDKLVDFFLANENVDLTKTNVRQTCGFDKHYFKSLFDSALPEVKFMLNKLGYNLEEYAGSGNTKILRARKLSSQLPYVVNLSVSKLKSMNDTPTKYEFEELNVDEFVKLIKGKTAFVACELKNGKRNNANCLGNQNTLWLDFDDIKSMEAVKTLFEKYSYIAYTSKNHQKDKHGVVGDRFRLILFTNCIMPDRIDVYKRVMGNIITMYNADKACKEPSRFYWSNPETEVTLNKGEMFDWRPFDVDNSEKYRVIKSNIVKSGKGNTISDVLFTAEGDRRLRVEQVTKGQRNSELFRIAIFLCHLVLDGELKHQDAIDKMKDIINRIDKTDFGQCEINRMINIVERLDVE